MTLEHKREYRQAGYERCELCTESWPCRTKRGRMDNAAVVLAGAVRLLLSGNGTPDNVQAALALYDAEVGR